MNLHGVWLHLLGDALGSVVVIVSAALVEWTTWKKRTLADPIASILISLIILRSSWPLIRRSAKVLMQRAPETLPRHRLYRKLMRVPGVNAIHELHVWQLDSKRVIASFHVTLQSGVPFAPTCDALKKRLHRLGVHSSTIQPEWPGSVSSPRLRGELGSSACTDRFCGAKECTQGVCCPPRLLPMPDSTTSSATGPSSLQPPSGSDEEDRKSGEVQLHAMP
ncbi:MAG: hypothetical protein MHM6MM_003706 [Cercozoa sp. M6MM]